MTTAILASPWLDTCYLQNVIKTVIFDIDGTLLDSVDLHAQAWHEAFQHFGKIIPVEQVREQIGKGGDQLLPVFLSKEELQAFGKKLEEYRSDLWKKNFIQRVKLFPAVRPLFETLKNRGIARALASSSKKDELDHYKRVLQIEDLVETNTSADDAERSKPHPDIFQAALERAGADPRHSVAVGDTPYDAEAAGKAAMQTIGVLCGGFPEAWLRDAGCIAIYRDPADLLEHLDDWVQLTAEHPIGSAV
jgi:HAD superfamily hydrolase (TIGR01509 family)